MTMAIAPLKFVGPLSARQSDAGASQQTGDPPHLTDRTLLITGRDVCTDTIGAFAQFGSQYAIADEGLLVSRAAPLNSQSETQVAMIASRTATMAVRRLNPSATINMFDPSEGTDSILWLEKKVANSDLVVCLTSSNLLRILGIRAAANTGSRLFTLNSRLEFQCFAAGKTGCFTCPKRRPAWRLRPGLVPDLALIAETIRKRAQSVPGSGPSIVARTRCGRPVFIDLPGISPAENCSICGIKTPFNSRNGRYKPSDGSRLEVRPFGRGQDLHDYHDSQADGYYEGGSK
jgi:hypothetical protein